MFTWPWSGSGAARWLLPIWLVLLLLLIAPLPRAQGAPGAHSSASTEQAKREIFTALSVGNPGHAEEILDRAFRADPDPALQYQMGLIAQAQGRQIAALDHYRRYQELVGSSIPPEIRSTIESFASGVSVPLSVVNISAGTGMLLVVDDHLVGMLPLRTPLLLGGGAHRFRIEQRSERYESGKLAIPEGREAELRLTAGAQGKAVAVLSLSPITLFVLQPSTLPRSSAQTLFKALTDASRKNHLAPLSEERIALLVSKRSARCLEEPDCQYAIAEQAQARSLLRVLVQETENPNPAAAERRCSVQLEYLDINAGQVSASGTTASMDCAGPRLTEALASVIQQLLADSDKRSRGMVSVNSVPEGAHVRVDGLLRGQTPYLRTSFSGSHEITVEKDGFHPFHTKVEVVQGAVASTRAELVAKPPEPAKEKAPIAAPAVKREWVERRQPRPRWRLALGGIAVSGGAVLAGFGISALSLNGRCLMEPMGGGVCDASYTTAAPGGSLLGAGLALTAGGIVLLALPGRIERVSREVGPD